MTINFLNFNIFGADREKTNSIQQNTPKLNNIQNKSINNIFGGKIGQDKNPFEVSGKTTPPAPSIFDDKPKFTSPLNTKPVAPGNFLKQTCNVKDLASSMVKIIDAKDNYTGQHSKAVQEYAKGLAKKLGLSEYEVENISMGSAFHDVGKIGVSDNILKSELPLSTDEFEEIKKHPEIGYKILEDIPAFKGTVSKIVKHHHENWDGSGYPDKLSGENIPLGARIVAIADAYHAMTSDRPYRKALSRQESLSRLKEGAGKQWDPALVDEFIKTNSTIANI